MALNGFLTGFDDCFEAQWLPMRTFPGVHFSHRKLTNSIAKKVKPDTSLIRSQGMSDSRFVWTQPEPHAFEPFYYKRCSFLQFIFVGMKDDKIISISYDDGFSILILCLSYRRFHPMQSYIHEQG